LEGVVLGRLGVVVFAGSEVFLVSEVVFVGGLEYFWVLDEVFLLALLVVTTF
jgi:hypothetical protein